MDPQQELFTRLLLDLKAHFEPQGYGVYDTFLPPEDTPYPFVYIGSFKQRDRRTKSQIIGVVFPVIHVWHNNPRQRGTVSQMLSDIKTICRKIEHTENLSWNVDIANEDIFEDRRTKQPLLHGVVEATANFS